MIRNFSDKATVARYRGKRLKGVSVEVMQKATAKPKNKHIIVEKQATIHPGRILLEEFLEPYGISQAALARHIGVGIVVVNDVVRGKRGINPRLALLLGDAFGNGPEIWFNMQANYDFCRERDALRRTGKIKHVEKLPELAGAGI